MHFNQMSNTNSHTHKHKTKEMNIYIRILSNAEKH